MRKMGIGVLVLVTSFAFGSVKIYAQCADPVQWWCTCDGTGYAGYLVENGAAYYPQTQARCCHQIVPNIYLSAAGYCLAPITQAMHKELEHLALYSRVFLVACNGDFPYTDSLAPEDGQGWSAHRAISLYVGRLATRAR